MARRECARQTGFSSLWRQLAEKKTRYAITSTERVGRKSACRQARCGAKRIYCISSLFVLQFSKLHTFENCCVATLSNVYPYPFYTALILRNIQHPFTASHNEWLLLSGVVIIISTRDEFSIRLSPMKLDFHQLLNTRAHSRCNESTNNHNRAQFPASSLLHSNANVNSTTGCCFNPFN